MLFAATTVAGLVFADSVILMVSGATAKD
jgi:hypothetical protein